jgi:hypothetical protein
MTVPTDRTADLDPGDLRLYDNDVPALAAGTYFVQVDHVLEHAGAAVATDELAARQSFVVSAPQFRIDPAAVRSAYPPDGSSGRYGTVLPYVVLDDPMLPFERPMPGPADPADPSGLANRQPWLAVLAFRPGELVDGADSPTATRTTTIGRFLAGGPGRRVPRVTPAPEVKTTDPCTYISVPAAVFKEVAPRLAELRFLTHCRHASALDLPTASGGESLTSVVVANRFATMPAPGAPAVRTIAHLVSLEGLDQFLDGGSALAGTDTVDLISLYSWSFWSYDSGEGDFESLARGLVIRPGAAGAPSVPADLLLRLPVPPTAADPATAEVVHRLTEGFVPLEYRLPTGDTTFAWYRGPLSPVPGDPVPRPPLRSVDAARGFVRDFGVFDLGLAAAWQAGRAAALADHRFGTLLLDFHRRTHSLVDSLYQRLASDHFTAAQVAELDTSTTAQSTFLSVLTTQLLADAGRGPQPDPSSTSSTSSTASSPPVGAAPSAPDPDPQAALTAFLADPEVRALILASVRDDLDPIATWLAGLLLLEHVPFAHLVPDERLLPSESLRLGYLDPAWQSALLDGALSLGIESSLRALYASLTGDLIRGAARQAAAVRRSELLGVAPPPTVFPTRPDPTVVCGLLVRSALVTGWPDLAVRACDYHSVPIPMLRMDRLSPSVLLCLFDGVPATVTLGEPPHGLRFGVQDDGRVPLRQPRAGAAGAPALGTILTAAAPVPVLDPSGRRKLALRDAGTGVLNLDPHDPTSLVGRLAAALDTAAPDPARVLGPADLALQMIKSPETLLLGMPPSPPPREPVHA